MKVTPFETYQSYLSMKSHFTNRKYDFFRYGGKSRATMASFNKRKDKYWFEKTSRKYLPSRLDRQFTYVARAISRPPVPSKLVTVRMSFGSSLSHPMKCNCGMIFSPACCNIVPMPRSIQISVCRLVAVGSRSWKRNSSWTGFEIRRKWNGKDSLLAQATASCWQLGCRFVFVLSWCIGIVRPDSRR